MFIIINYFLAGTSRRRNGVLSVEAAGRAGSAAGADGAGATAGTSLAGGVGVTAGAAAAGDWAAGSCAIAGHSSAK